MAERLDKIIASQTGLSRKEARLAVYKGEVSVNGEAALLADRRVDPETDEITYRGGKITYQKFIYIMMNKPKDVVSATDDVRERTVLDLLPDEFRRRGVFPAGRLDKDTTGLLILTNDGQFAHRLTAPGKKVYKTYIAGLEAPPTPDASQRFAKGILLKDGEKCLPAELTMLPDERVQVRICEGKYHQVKRMLAACGSRVVSLERTAVGSLQLDESLLLGEYRMLDAEELDKMLK